MVIGQMDISWAKDTTATGILAAVLIIIFLVLIPKLIDFYTNVLIKKLDEPDWLENLEKKITLQTKVELRNYKAQRHILRHLHEIMKDRGMECDHEYDQEDDEDGLELEINNET